MANLTEAVGSRSPAKVVVAVLTGSAAAVRWVENVVDQVICLDIPTPFNAVGNFYRNFGRTTDEEVRNLSHVAWGK